MFSTAFVLMKSLFVFTPIIGWSFRVGTVGLFVFSSGYLNNVAINKIDKDINECGDGFFGG